MTQRFLDNYIKAVNESYKYCKDKEIKRVKNITRLEYFTYEEVKTKVNKETFKKAVEQLRDLMNNHSNLFDDYLHEMNCLEAIATPIIAGVADSDTAFTSFGSSFCAGIENNWIYYAFYRNDKAKMEVSYANSIALYNIWKPMLEKHNLESSKKEIEKKLEEINIAKPKKLD